MIYQQQHSVEALVAMNMGDEDWEELDTEYDNGCSRKATSEYEAPAHDEAEPHTLKYNALFDVFVD